MIDRIDGIDCMLTDAFGINKKFVWNVLLHNPEMQKL